MWRRKNLRMCAEARLVMNNWIASLVRASVSLVSKHVCTTFSVVVKAEEWDRDIEGRSWDRLRLVSSCELVSVPFPPHRTLLSMPA